MNKEENESKNLRYEYLDGNSNQYLIEKEDKIIIEYIPIKPYQSSSRIYDGGDYIKKEISKLQYNQLKKSFNDTFKNKEIHIKDRVKRSGMIIIQEKSEKKICIINPDSQELQKIENNLKYLIKTQIIKKF